jgi:hypothetical protein
MPSARRGWTRLTPSGGTEATVVARTQVTDCRPAETTIGLSESRTGHLFRLMTQSSDPDTTSAVAFAKSITWLSSRKEDSPVGVAIRPIRGWMKAITLRAAGQSSPVTPNMKATSRASKYP